MKRKIFKKKIFLVLWITCFFPLFLPACSSGQKAAQAWPTQTPYPTQIPYPTQTPLPEDVQLVSESPSSFTRAEELAHYFFENFDQSSLPQDYALDGLFYSDGETFSEEVAGNANGINLVSETSNGGIVFYSLDSLDLNTFLYWGEDSPVEVLPVDFEATLLRQETESGEYDFLHFLFGRWAVSFFLKADNNPQQQAEMLDIVRLIRDELTFYQEEAFREQAENSNDLEVYPVDSPDVMGFQDASLELTEIYNNLDNNALPAGIQNLKTGQEIFSNGNVQTILKFNTESGEGTVRLWGIDPHRYADWTFHWFLYDYYYPFFEHLLDFGFGSSLYVNRIKGRSYVHVVRNTWLLEVEVKNINPEAQEEIVQMAQVLDEALKDYPGNVPRRIFDRTLADEDITPFYEGFFGLIKQDEVPETLFLTPWYDMDESRLFSYHIDNPGVDNLRRVFVTYRDHWESMTDQEGNQFEGRFLAYFQDFNSENPALEEDLNQILSLLDERLAVYETQIDWQALGGVVPVLASGAQTLTWPDPQPIWDDLLRLEDLQHCTNCEQQIVYGVKLDPAGYIFSVSYGNALGDPRADQPMLGFTRHQVQIFDAKIDVNALKEKLKRTVYRLQPHVSGEPFVYYDRNTPNASVLLPYENFIEEVTLGNTARNAEYAANLLQNSRVKPEGYTLPEQVEAPSFELDEELAENSPVSAWVSDRNRIYVPLQEVYITQMADLWIRVDASVETLEAAFYHPETSTFLQYVRMNEPRVGIMRMLLEDSDGRGYYTQNLNGPFVYLVWVDGKLIQQVTLR